MRRLLPSRARRTVGPFVFLDHMGPADLAPGTGVDVPPHPHIGLATVTYLFEGELVHRDSLGSLQPIRAGAVNWMTAGRGIVHSERTEPELRNKGSRLHGIQLWVGLPRAQEETAPDFRHYPAQDLPEREIEGVIVRVLAGRAFGLESPVSTWSPLFYADASLPPGSSLRLPAEHQERALYVALGSVSSGPVQAEAGRLLVFEAGAEPIITTERGARLILLGGKALDGERHLFWNFVSSDKARLDRARIDWSEGRFPLVPGDEKERVPLPE